LSKRILRVALYAFVALIALGAGLWASSSRQTAVPSVNSAQVLWALSLPDLNNQPQRLEQWRGKVVVVNFWATWCEPCRKEIPLFVKMQEKHAAKGLQFVGISIDQVDKTSEFARNFKINYPTLIGTFDAVEVSQKAGNQRRGLPFTVILDRKGQIAATELGGVTQEKLDALIAPLL